MKNRYALIFHGVTALFAFVCLTHVVASSELFKTIEDGNMNALKSELDSGVSANAEMAGNSTPLQLAISEEQEEVVNLLISRGADVNKVSVDDPVPPLHLAMDIGNLSIIQALLENNVDVNRPDENGQTAIFLAIPTSNTGAMIELIKFGADVNYAGPGGVTPLVMAMQGKRELVKLLIDNGAKIEGDKIAELGACSSCHGRNGRGHPSAGRPPLAGQNEAYLAKQLRDFLHGRRIEPAMNREVKLMNDDVIQSIAGYYAAQEFVPHSFMTDSAAAQRGKQIYNGPAGCGACHGSDGKETVSPLIPSLRGLREKYVVDQLVAFQNGKRKNDTEGLMVKSVSGLTKEQIADLGSFVQTMK